MKLFIISFLFLVNNPIISHASSIDTYEEKHCFRNVYKEKYIKGNSHNPGYVASWEERINIPCNNNYINKRDKIKVHDSRTKPKKCNETLGGLVGGGIAASLSAVDAYGWSIPLGLVLGRGIANADC